MSKQADKYLETITSLRSDIERLEKEKAAVSRRIIELHTMLDAIETEYAESLSTIKKGDKVLWLTSKNLGTIWNPQREKQEIPCVVEKVFLAGIKSVRTTYRLRLLKKDGTPSARFADRGYPIEKEAIKQAK